MSNNNFLLLVCTAKIDIENDNFLFFEDPCIPNPCENNGNCILVDILPEGRICDCPQLFTGNFCEIESECL